MEIYINKQQNTVIMKLKNVLVVCKDGAGPETKKSISVVKKILKDSKIKFKAIMRNKIKKSDTKSKDLIIVVGGDGSLLYASHFITDKTPILCINSNTKLTEGFYSYANRFDFKKKLKQLLENKNGILELNRLEAKIGKKKLDLALNDYYIGHKTPYGVARYWLSHKGKKEYQKSSGVVVSTASGSFAWMKSAGGKQLPMTSPKFEYIVREPYHGKLVTPTMINGILEKNQKIKIISNSDNLIVNADSVSPDYPAKKKSIIEVSLSKKPIYLVTFPL
jgi:NAD kinase